MDVIIKPTDVIPETTFTRTFQITNQPVSLKEINERTDVVLVLNLKSNDTFKMLLNAESRITDSKWPDVLNWTQNYVIKRYHNETIVLALPGSLRSIIFWSKIKSNFVGVNVTYKWFYSTTGSSKNQKGGKNTIRIIRPNKEKPHKHVIIPAERGEYHFHMICFCGCYSTLRKCKRFHSWNQAAVMCQEKGGHLPQFLSRAEQEELISMLKEPGYFFFIEALFISMKVSNQSRFVCVPIILLLYNYTIILESIFVYVNLSSK